MVELCTICTQPATQRCSRCHVTYYCSREHQKLDWGNHRDCCCPFKVARDEVLGRHFLAARSLKAGDVVLSETPLVTGPPPVQQLVCVSCYKTLVADGGGRCHKCGWTVCDQRCADSEVHRPECELACRKGGHKVDVEPLLSSHPVYHCLTILRCLLLRDSHPKVWAKLQALESHCMKRKAIGQYEQERNHVAKFLLTYFGLQGDFTEEDVLRMCGIVQVNNYPVRLMEPFYLAVYDVASFIEHSCIPNCAKVFTASGELIIKVAVPVARGQHLSICYTDARCGTTVRRRRLKAELLECRCERCSDPTELGSYYSALRCQASGCSGYILPESALVEDSNNNTPCTCIWHCRTCGATMPTDSVSSLLQCVSRAEVVLDKSAPKSCEHFLATHGTLLHMNHYLLMSARLALARRPARKASDAELATKVTIARQLLELADRILPAENGLRGVLMFELSIALVETERRRVQSDDTLVHELAARLEEPKRLLKLADSVLSDQPDIIPEGIVAKLAKEKLLAFDSYLSISVLPH